MTIGTFALSSRGRTANGEALTTAEMTAWLREAVEPQTVTRAQPMTLVESASA